MSQTEPDNNEIMQKESPEASYTFPPTEAPTKPSLIYAPTPIPPHPYGKHLPSDMSTVSPSAYPTDYQTGYFSPGPPPPTSPPVPSAYPTDYQTGHFSPGPPPAFPPVILPASYQTDYQTGYFSPAGTTHLQTPLQMYKDYVKLRIKYSSKKASRQRLIHNILQIIILVGAALVSISLGFPHTPSWLPPLISGAVTIATAIASYYKFGDRSRDLYRSAEDIQQEYNWFKSKRGPYKKMNDAEAFEILQDRIDLLKREHFLRTFSFENQKEDQK